MSGDAHTVAPYTVFLPYAEYTVVMKPVRPYTVYTAFQAKTPHTVYRIFYRTSTLQNKTTVVQR